MWTYSFEAFNRMFETCGERFHQSSDVISYQVRTCMTGKVRGILKSEEQFQGH